MAAPLPMRSHECERRGGAGCSPRAQCLARQPAVGCATQALRRLVLAQEPTSFRRTCESSAQGTVHFRPQKRRANDHRILAPDCAVEGPPEGLTVMVQATPESARRSPPGWNCPPFNPLNAASNWAASETGFRFWPKATCSPK